MSNEDQNTFPRFDPDWCPQGLTKREHFAALAMQGLCAYNSVGRQRRPESIAGQAVHCADALLAALEDKA